MILAGDIGGTHARLAYFQGGGPRPIPLHARVFPSREFGSLAEVVERFVAEETQSVTGACFGVAGPVQGGRARTPNLPWLVDSGDLAHVLGLEAVMLVNDLEASAHALSILRGDDLVVLSEGDRDASGNAALISAGTGLGEAGLRWDGERYAPFATEGGHADFAPRNPLEIELLTWMLERWDHVSYERLVSGPGLHNIYCFLVDTGRGEEPEWLRNEIQKSDPAVVIASAALERETPVCQHALEVFVSIYGAEAGNLALKMLATGGVYVGGGIAAKLVAKLRGPAFLEAFRDKGRMRALLERMPVEIVVNENAALLGAAALALAARQMRSGAQPARDVGHQTADRTR